MVDSRQLVYSELNPLKVSQEQEQEQQNLEGNLQIEKLLELEMVLVMQLDLEQEQELLMMVYNRLLLQGACLFLEIFCFLLRRSSDIRCRNCQEQQMALRNGLDVDASVGVPETDRTVLAAAEAVVSVGVQPRG
ncbi:hypothetical protein LINPERPRIM_LOCUS41707 [Linum perenne]